MKISVSIFVLTFTIVSCDKRETKENSLTTQTTKEVSTDSIEIKNKIIQDILDLPKMQWIYRSEMPDRLPIKILKSEIVTNELKFKKFDKDVLILTKEELGDRSDFIDFKKFKFNGDTLTFRLTYAVQGAFVVGQFIKSDNNWTIDNYKVGEY